MGSMVLVCAGFRGEKLCELEIPKPGDVTFSSVKNELIQKLSAARSSDGSFRFMLTDGSVIERDRENFMSLSALLRPAEVEPAEVEPAEVEPAEVERAELRGCKCVCL